MQSRRSRAGAGGASDVPHNTTLDDVDGVTTTKTNKSTQWYTHPSIQWVLQGCTFLSLVSICFNTPATFENQELKKYKIIYVTFAVDLAILMVFALEMVIKMLRFGVIKSRMKTKNAYMRDHWCRFELTMLVILLISVVLHVVQILNFDEATGEHFAAGWIGILRSPRPLIFVRVFRLLLTEKLPTARISQIIKRSGHQIYNVTLFFLFFMWFYGILGVQFFGALRYHCVLKEADPDNITKSDLAIPDTPCTPRNDSAHGYVCPDNMKCIRIKGSYNVTGYSTFEHIPISFFSVYNAASQEGWSGVMYDTMDTLSYWKGYIYFISLIFLLAWLVKNVFIAVIIETFAEIRVQFQQMWGSHDTTSERSSMVLENEDNEWKLISLDARRPHGLAPRFLQRWVKSPYFTTIFMILILADALVAASRTSRRERSKENGKVKFEADAVYWAQVGFTVVFMIEVVLKVWVYGPRGYIRISRHKLELILAVVSCFNLIPQWYRGVLTYAQVLRIARLIKASPVLEEFCWKIFGPGKKLGSLVLFTISLLIITSGISLQLFCYIRNDEGEYHEQFRDFLQALQSSFQILSGENWSDPMYDLMRLSKEWVAVPIACYFVTVHLFMTAAFMSMFQILLKKGWTDIMYGTMSRAETHAAAAMMAVYFLTYHLLVTVIILSLFVAVILDNLDLDEDIKRLKQLKAREMSTAQQQYLPLRLRVFEKFSNQPQMVKVTKRMDTEFDAPKVRESFMRTFVDSGFINNNNGGLRQRKPVLSVPQKELSDITLLSGKPSAKSAKQIFQMDEISDLVSESSEQRLMNSSDPLISRGHSTMPAPNSLLSANQGNSSSALRALMSRTVIDSAAAAVGVGNARANMRNPRMLSTESGGNRIRRNGNIPNVQTQTSNNTPARSNNNDDIDIQILQQKKQQAEIKRNQQESDLRENHPFFDTPLFMVGRESRFREICKTIVNARYASTASDNTTGGLENKVKYKKLAKFLSIVPILDWFMIFITVVSCIFMTLENPRYRITDETNERYSYMVVVEYIFVLSMSIEMALKIFAHGLFFTPNALIRDVGGFLDMFIYFTSFLFLVVMIIANPEGAGRPIRYGSAGHVLLILRCMRPLRIFILVPHIRKVVYELVRGAKEILLVTILLCVLLFVFASYGVQCYGGQLYRCNDITKHTRKECTGTFSRKIKVTDMNVQDGDKKVQIQVPRVWSNPYSFNFDNIFKAALALFEVLSLEGWLEIRDTLIDRVGPMESFYIHVFVFIGVLIGLTLFVGVVISNYSQNKGTALLTVDQRRWLDLKGRINLTQPLHVPPRPENNKFREKMFDITQNRFFKRTVAVIVALNSLLLVVPWHTNIPQGENLPEYTHHLQSGAVAFVIIFAFEVVMKLVALSPKGYWYSRRNRMDLFITIAAILWAILHLSFKTLKDLPDGLDDKEKTRVQINREIIDSIGYGVIILRFCTITGKHATLKMLMLTVWESMWKSFFLITGMFLLMLFYAYAGVLMFGMTRYGDNLNRHANFRTARHALVLLFRIVTGEDWNKIMHDCMISRPYCFTGKNYWQTDCGNIVLSGIYFCSFYVIITYIMLNLLVAIIMENFSLFYSNEEDALLSYSDIRMYQNTWNAVDLERKGAIPNKRVPELLGLLKGRLQIDHDSLPTKMLFKHMCYEIEYLHGGDSGEATFHDVLIMLSYRSVDIRKSLQLEELLAREDLEMTIAEDVAKKIISDWLTRCVKRMRDRGIESTTRRAPQEPFYVVTEAEETPLMEVITIESPPEADNTSKHRVMRNISEPVIGLQRKVHIPKKVTSTMSDPQVKERLKRNSLSTRSELSDGMNDGSAKEKQCNVDQWWCEQGF